MRKALKWIFRSVAILAIIFAIIAVLGYVYLMRSVPQENGSVQLAGLESDVRVTRDREGIPHIIGKSIYDVAAAQGFIHAQDRLWQMETFRMAGQGRLSQMFGEKTIDTDKFLRTLNLADYSKKSFEKLTPETQKILQSYASGINAFVNRKVRIFEPTLPIEFMILGHKPDKWQAWHSLLTIKVMALTLGANMSHEIRRLALASKGFNPREIDNLVPYHSKDTPPPLPDLRELYGFPTTGKVRQAEKKNNGAQKLTASHSFDLEWPIGVTASNNWVVGGNRTKSGKVLLANDPHLGLTAPSIWYLAHLSWEQDGKLINLIGASMPSIPLVMLGRNDRVAWGFTTTALDSQDLYIERINPEDENQYKTASGWENLGVREEIIKVSGQADVKYTVRSTSHGPVLPSTYKNLERYLPDGHVVALNWVALTDDDTSIDGLVKITGSTNVKDVFDAARLLVSPMQTIVIGDVEGNIGMLAPARVPVRSDENLIKGRAPVLGWEPKYEWSGYLKFEQLPQWQNPTNNVLFSANSKIVDQYYPSHITYDWASEFRHDRVEELISSSNAPHDTASMIAGHTDDYSAALVELRDITLPQIPTGASKNQDILEALANWKGDMSRESYEPLVMMAWFKALSEALLQDDLGEDFELFAKGNIVYVLNILRSGGARDWCDDRNSPGLQTCQEVIGQSFNAAISDLEIRYGADRSGWRWGRAHMALGEHRPFAKVPPLDKLFNVEVETGGGPYTLHRSQTDFREDAPYRTRHASSYRAIYDFSDLNNSIYMHTTGQSGNFMSPHYDDFANRWANTEYMIMSTNPKDYENYAIGVWEFTVK